MTTKRKVVNVIAAILKYGLLILGSVFTVLPFIWMISSSLKTPSELIAVPPALFPEVPQSFQRLSCLVPAKDYCKTFRDSGAETIFLSAGLAASLRRCAFFAARLFNATYCGSDSSGS